MSHERIWGLWSSRYTNFLVIIIIIIIILCMDAAEQNHIQF